MQQQATVLTNPPTNDPANDEKREEVLQLLSEMDLDKASLLMYLQS